MLKRGQSQLLLTDAGLGRSCDRHGQVFYGVRTVLGMVGRGDGKVEGACACPFKDEAVAIESIAFVNRDRLLVQIRDLDILRPRYLFVYAALFVPAHVSALRIIEVDVHR